MKRLVRRCAKLTGWKMMKICQEHTLWCINETVSMVIALTPFYTSLREVCIALTWWYEKHVRYSNHQQNINTNHLKLAITITTWRGGISVSLAALSYVRSLFLTYVFVNRWPLGSLSLLYMWRWCWTGSLSQSTDSWWWRPWWSSLCWQRTTTVNSPSPLSFMWTR